MAVVRELHNLQELFDSDRHQYSDALYQEASWVKETLDGFNYLIIISEECQGAFLFVSGKLGSGKTHTATQATAMPAPWQRHAMVLKHGQLSRIQGLA